MNKIMFPLFYLPLEMISSKTDSSLLTWYQEMTGWHWMEFSCGSAGVGSIVVTAITQVTAMVRVWSPASELHVSRVVEWKHGGQNHIGQKQQPHHKEPIPALWYLYLLHSSSVDSRSVSSVKEVVSPRLHSSRTKDTSAVSVFQRQVLEAWRFLVAMKGDPKAFWRPA